jgi:hypothetical protein
MRKFILWAAVGVAGCAGDLDVSRLDQGREAMAYAPPGEIIAVEHTGGRDGEAWIAAGTRLRVIDDPGGDRLRRVRVLVLEGEGEGKVGTLHRAKIRPLPR